MFFWVTSLLMLTVAMLFVLLPLARKGVGNGEGLDSTQIYRDQLLQIENRIDDTGETTDADIRERAEVGRRLLKAARENETNTDFGFRKSGVVVASLLILIGIPATSIGLYALLGSPTVEDAPIVAQRSKKLEDRSIEEMVRIAEKHLAKNPNDTRGWAVLADVYGKLNRSSDRANALEQIIRLSGSTPSRLAELGEALTIANGNIVSSRARQMFQTALQQDPKILKASVYMAMAMEQEGRYSDAANIWEILSQERKDDQNWQAMTADRIAALRAKSTANLKNSVGPTTEDVENASTMTSADRTEMIEGMVERLAGKLKDEPNDLNGWMRLVRSYVVLKEPGKATVALGEARQVFSNQPNAISELNKLANAMNIADGAGGQIKELSN